MLLSYGRNGTFSEEEIRKATVDMDEFWGKEYVKFRNAVDELFRLQNSLCEESESDVLNEADCEVLHEKAKSLGFYNKDYIAAVIRGNGIRRKQ